MRPAILLGLALLLLLSSAALAGGDASFIDPVVGVRGNFPVTRTLLFVFRGDVGGFTVGSNFSSNFGLALHWAAAQKWGSTSSTAGTRLTTRPEAGRTSSTTRTLTRERSLA